MPTRRATMNPASRPEPRSTPWSCEEKRPALPDPAASRDGPADNTRRMASSAGSPRAVRIATLNTWGTRGNWTERRRVLSDGLLALDADLLTLQETIVDDGYDQAADVLDSRYQIIHQQDRETDGQGITTASRWPVGEITELDINVTSRTGDFACASLITEILAPPFDAEVARRHLLGTSFGRALRGFRAVEYDVDAVVEVLLIMQHIGTTVPEVASLEINPLFVGRAGAGVVAADAKLELRARR